MAVYGFLLSEWHLPIWKLVVALLVLSTYTYVILALVTGELKIRVNR